MIIATACMQVYVSVRVKFYFLLHNLFERSQIVCSPSVLSIIFTVQFEQS